MDYHEFATDLHTLANLLEAHAADLPLPRYAGQCIDWDVHVPEDYDVVTAAQTLGSPVTSNHGHTTTTIDLGSVRLRFVHITSQAQQQYQQYQQRQALLAKMQASS